MTQTRGRSESSGIRRGLPRPAASLASMIDIDQRFLTSGLPVVSLQMPGTRSVTLLAAFDAGARTEHPEENGMAHFLEHLVFKGGEKYATYRDVNETAERLGAQLNAYTSHDIVAFHITCRSEAIMEAADLITDFVARAQIDADELERERGVVIQEIARSDDQPASVADKLLDRAVYGEHPLGRPVLGPADHLRTFSRDAVLAFRDRRWAPDRGGAFIAGDLSHADADRIDELFSRFPARNHPPSVDPAPGFERRVFVESRDSNQSHLRLHWRPSIDAPDRKQRAALAVYSTLLGGSMGSRLFDEIREQRGLCYAIRSYGYAHTDAANLEVSSGLQSDNAVEAYERIKEIVRDVAETGPRDGEVERARSYTAGSTVLALESTGAVARRVAGEKVTFGEIYSPDETIAALDAVTEDDVREVAAGIAGEPVVAVVGPHEAADFQ
jgi:predicted Zn-dependent peptidase